MKCYECNREMMKVSRRIGMAEMDDDVTDGQLADYMAAESSGDFGSWAVGIVAYQCNTCEISLEVISDELKDLNVLIKRWHEKARAGDYFEKYVFEYLSFNAYLKVHVAGSSARDRDSIELMKGRFDLRDSYLKIINSEQEPMLREIWMAVIDELKRQPLRNSSRDYDHPEVDGRWTEPSESHISDKRRGVVHSLNDWANMVEFWYAVRNNLFHAGKDPTLKRDNFLVEHAFISLNSFMKMIMKEKGYGFVK